jgi:hypothetical protein
MASLCAYFSSAQMLSLNSHLFIAGGFVCGSDNYLGICHVVICSSVLLFAIFLCNPVLPLLFSGRWMSVVTFLIVLLSSSSFSLPYKWVRCFRMLFLFFMCRWGHMT